MIHLCKLQSLTEWYFALHSWRNIEEETFSPWWSLGFNWSEIKQWVVLMSCEGITVLAPPLLQSIFHCPNLDRPIPSDIQGQAGWGSGQPGLMGVESRWSSWFFSTWAILWFYGHLEPSAPRCVCQYCHSPCTQLIGENSDVVRLELSIIITSLKESDLRQLRLAEDLFW